MAKCFFRLKSLLIFSFLMISAATSAGQIPGAVPDCELPPLSVTNMFNAQQEVDLGDVLAESSVRFLQPVEDKELTANLERIGERLVKHLPPTGLHFRFYVSNAPIANAFSIAGGRVYVTRKLIRKVRDCCAWRIIQENLKYMTLRPRRNSMSSFSQIQSPWPGSSIMGIGYSCSPPARLLTSCNRIYRRRARIEA
jgi:hypothetical protein